MATELFNDLGRVYVSIDYDPERQWVICTWLGNQNTASILLGTDASLMALKQHGCCCLLNDNRQIAGTWSSEVVDGLISNWATLAIQAGLTHMATVAYPDSIAAIYEEVMQLNLADRLRMRLFHSLLPAQRRLLASQAPR